MHTPRTIEWVGGTDGFVRLIDQTLLPTRLEYRDCRTVEEVWEAIKVLRVRGAPAIGVAAAMGTVVGMQKFRDHSRGAYRTRLKEVTDLLRTSRPTAVNLLWPLAGGADAETARRGPGHRSGRPRHVPGHRRGRRGADRRRAGRADPLQRRRAGHGGLRHGPGGAVHRGGAGAPLSRLRRRTAA